MNICKNLISYKLKEVQCICIKEVWSAPGLVWKTGSCAAPGSVYTQWLELNLDVSK
jgi:hypothetical protein